MSLILTSQVSCFCLGRLSSGRPEITMYGGRSHNLEIDEESSLENVPGLHDRLVSKMIADQRNWPPLISSCCGRGRAARHGKSGLIRDPKYTDIIHITQTICQNLIKSQPNSLFNFSPHKTFPLFPWCLEVATPEKQHLSVSLAGVELAGGVTMGPRVVHGLLSCQADSRTGELEVKRSQNLDRVCFM